ncbi:outer membrane protein assembly factor BamB [Limnohabitans sp. T6-20]|uniref:outer membrane protein assembly factor BamB n=1 Tax=Limnohabitans sp. T6-20 TaxID=1100725 RepID=UPI000D39C911|nr:outer membrane protein assembly factor BamB [Limnohabitans sp. T6-20]PUE10525.1 outer membrane protein assembly factor BamB [Limnohabitans sp. T6-20]
MTVFSNTWIRVSLLGALAIAISACSSAPEKPQPAALPAVSGQLAVQKIWSNSIGAVTTPLFASVHGDQVAVASTQGQVALINAGTGQDVWRLNLNTPIQAGVSGDGQRFAVITQTNEVVAIEAGKVVWRYRLPALSYTAPLVAGARVFVLTADRAVTALDGASGQKLWTQQRTGDPLVLQQAGLLIPFGDTLLAGWGGRLASLNPSTGAVRWETLIGSSRGTNEVERMVDLVAGASRQGNAVCVRAFQSAVSCVDANRGTTLWTRPAQGHEGLDGDENLVFGAESDSKVVAWQRQGGQPAWTQDALRFRGLSAPLVLGRSVVLGDDKGLVHFLARQDGQALQRLSTDGSAVVGKPVAAGQTLVVVTRTGGVFGFRPE